MGNLDTYTLAGRPLNVNMVLSEREVRAFGGNIANTRGCLIQRVDGVRLFWEPKERSSVVSSAPLHESYSLADITKL